MLSLLVLLCETRTGVKDISLVSQSFPITDCPNLKKKDKCDPYEARTLKMGFAFEV